MHGTGKNDLDFEDFPGFQKEDWLSKVEQDLKGEDPSSLNWKPINENTNLILEPYYTREDLWTLGYLRKFHESMNPRKGWSIFVSITSTNDLSRRIRELNNAGIGSLLIDLRDPSHLEHLSEEGKVYSTNLAVRTPEPASISEFLNTHKTLNIEIKYLIPADPVKDLSKKIWPPSKSVSGNFAITSFHPAADTQLLEILTDLNQFIQSSVDAGENTNELLNRLFFHINICTDFFLEISKMRALRVLLKALLRAHSLPDDLHIPVLCNSAYYTDTAYEPHENILKATYNSMAAVIGGCDDVVINLDIKEDMPAILTASRIEDILRDEAQLDKITDPAGGSYFVDSLTHQLVIDVWEKFKSSQIKPL